MICHSAFAKRLMCAWVGLALALSAGAAQAMQPETPEIVFTSPDARLLTAKAAQLGNAVAIYEYARNRFEPLTYQGSRSGSVNTFLGQRGNDIDIATTLIAMMRAQNIPARYAVGTIRLSAAQLTNWLGIPNLDVAVQILMEQGVQKVSVATDRSAVDLEHTWAEVLVPFDQYRGLNTVSAVDCTQAANLSRCNWVPLDAAYKQKTYNGLNLDPYNALSFDYTGYYNAIKNSATDTLQRKDKNPLTILEEQITNWLRTSHPGNTLDDVADAGRIIEVHDGLLPASLPYRVISNIRRYDSVALHDAAVPTTETNKWAKYITLKVDLPTGTTLNSPTQNGTVPLLLARLNTQRLTMTTEFTPPGNVPHVVIRLGGAEVARPIASTSTITGYTPAIGDPFTLTITMDGAPDPTGGSSDRDIKAIYQGAVGNYYLIATGGEYSNWSQVHRAADQLLDSNSNYRILLNAGQSGCQPLTGLNCTPYVDANNNGLDATDLPLLFDKNALDALTGGLLYVAGSQYLANYREAIERANRLMKIKSPIVGFAGVVSSVFDVEYINGTAFSVLPGGLLIDVRGASFGGVYRTTDVPANNLARNNYSSRQFEFLGHVGSSLEHEIWQALTGYDAVSTVRGFQMALANGDTLVNPKKNSTQDTLPGLYPTFGFTATVPSGFTYAPFTIFNTAPSTWSNVTSNTSFDTLLGTVNTAMVDYQRQAYTYSYSDTTSGLYGFANCAANQISIINAVAANAIFNQGATCFQGTSLVGLNKAQALAAVNTDWSSFVIFANKDNLGEVNHFFDYFDRNQGFTPTGITGNTSRLYRVNPAPVSTYLLTSIAAIRNDLYLTDPTLNWFEYLLPATVVTAPNNRFEVSISKEYDTPTGRLVGLTFGILNRGN